MLIISAEKKRISEIYGEGNTSPCFLYEIKAELVRAKHGSKRGVECNKKDGVEQGVLYHSIRCGKT